MGQQTLGRAVADVLAKSQTDFDALAGWQQIQIAWMGGNPLEECAKFIQARPEVRLFRVRATQRLMFRLAFWRMCDQLRDGVDPGDVKASTPQHLELVNGAVELSPGSMPAAPLFARSQPLAALLLTSQGAQVAVLTDHGMFDRPLGVSSWPVGLPGPRFSAAERQVYRSASRTFAVGAIERMFRENVDATNRLLDRLTDPGLWVDGSGEINLDDRWASWTTVGWGFDSLASLAANWGDEESFWIAFRSLGLLLGARREDLQLHDLLDPARIRRDVLPHLPDDIRSWSGDVVENYAEELNRLTRPGMPEATRQVQDLRNAVHGIFASKTDPHRRLRVLRNIAGEQPGLQLVIDIAVMWWWAALIAPESVLRI